MQIINAKDLEDNTPLSFDNTLEHIVSLKLEITFGEIEEQDSYLTSKIQKTKFLQVTLSERASIKALENEHIYELLKCIQEGHKEKKDEIDYNPLYIYDALGFFNGSLLYEKDSDVHESCACPYHIYQAKEDKPTLEFFNGGWILDLCQDPHKIEEGPFPFFYGTIKPEKNQTMTLTLTFKGIAYDENTHYLFHLEKGH